MKIVIYDSSNLATDVAGCCHLTELFPRFTETELLLGMLHSFTKHGV